MPDEIRFPELGYQISQALTPGDSVETIEQSGRSFTHPRLYRRFEAVSDEDPTNIHGNIYANISDSMSYRYDVADPTREEVDNYTDVHEIP